MGDKGPSMRWQMIQPNMTKAINPALVTVLGCLILCASWTDVFRAGRWGTPASLAEAGVIVVSGLAVIAAFRARQVLLQDWVFMGFLVLAAISAALSPNTKSLSYLLAYGFAFAGLAVIARLAAKNLGRYYPLLMRINAIAVLFIAAFSVLEFLLRYYGDYSIQYFIPRGNIADATLYIFPRSYGFSEEPTYLSWYLNTLGILAIWNISYWGINLFGRCALYALILLANFMTFSLAGAGALIVAWILSGVAILVIDSGPTRLLALASKRQLLPILLTSLIFLAMAVVATSTPKSLFSPTRVVIGQTLPASAQAIIPDTSGEPDAVERLMDKVRGGTEDARQSRWTAHLKLAGDRPWLGWGPGYLASQGGDSSNNLFIFVATEVGAPAALLLVVGFALVAWRIVTDRRAGAIVFFAAFVAGIIHLLSMSQFYHPCLWLVVILYEVFRASEKEPEQYSESTSVL